jgi:hypothetical protein
MKKKFSFSSLNIKGQLINNKIMNKKKFKLHFKENNQYQDKKM